MPHVRITLRGGRPAAQLRAISECLHAAMVATFDVPLNDRFHFFQVNEAEEIFVDTRYLSSGRTAGFMHFEIVAGKPRSAAAKAALYRQLAAGLHDSLGISPADVMVVVVTTTPEDWSFADGLTAGESMERHAHANPSA
ncbi:MAG: tautomerase family protein [Pseudomonadota bacterium]